MLTCLDFVTDTTELKCQLLTTN